MWRRLHTTPILSFLTIAAAMLAAGPALAAQEDAQDRSAAAGRADDEPVVRSFGSEGGYRTEVTSSGGGTLSPADRRHVSLLAAQLFQHIDEARDALEADEIDRARDEVGRGHDVVDVIREILPSTTVQTRTTSPSGETIYEDERTVQQRSIPIYEGMLEVQTLAPIIEAKRDAADVAGVRLIESSVITTEVTMDLDFVESRLDRASRALGNDKPERAMEALASAQVDGIAFDYREEASPLVEARDAIWLAKRALEEDNPVQAAANLLTARRRLRLYRELLPEADREGVDRMLAEVEQLEDQLREETREDDPATRAERTRQRRQTTGWWDRVTDWFDDRF